MKIKKLFILLFTLTLVSCGSANNESTSDSSNTSQTTNQEVTVYLDLGDGGTYKGQPGNKIPSLYLENAVSYTALPGSELPGGEDVKNMNGEGVVGWTMIPGHGHNENVEVVPNIEGLVLYANYDISSVCDWFIVGEGSFVKDGITWDARGGIPMVINDEYKGDGIEYKALEVVFEAGDVWKINNPKTNQWVESGWEGNEGSAIANGDMETVPSGYENSYNISVLKSGTYDIYLKLYSNNTHSVWIARSPEA